MLKNLGILSKICTFFEKLVDPYPSEILTVKSNRFFLFLGTLLTDLKSI